MGLSLKKEIQTWKKWKICSQLLQITCAMMMPTGNESKMNKWTTWPIFWLFAVNGSVGGPLVCAGVRTQGDEEGERKATGRSLSGGIKVLLQWWKGQL